MPDSAPATSNGPDRRRWLAWATALGWGAPCFASRALKPIDPGRLLPDAVRATLQASRLPLDTFGVHAQPIDGAPPLIALNAEQPYVMASTAKTVTAMAALDLLGPGYRWRTRAFARGLVVDGHLYGDLVLVGGGDVLLTPPVLRDWFREIQALGLRHVHGRILLDHSAFRLNESDFAGTPEPAPDRPHHARPDALALDAGRVRRAVAERWLDAGGQLSGRVEDQPTDPLRATTVPPTRAGQAMTLWSTHRSPDLATWVHGMNKASDNVAARHLLLSLAPGFPSRPATPHAALERLQRWIRQRGLADDDLCLDNGSGLSRAERAKPRALVQLLRQSWAARWADTFIDSLPVAGIDGTLAHRLTGRAVQGRAHLKTGTLLDVRALAGYVQGRSGRWHALAAMANHPDAALAVPSLDAMVQWLVNNG